MPVSVIYFNKYLALKKIPDNFCKILFSNNKQLLDEVEHDIMNYQNRGLCYLPKPKAEADNTDTRLLNDQKFKIPYLFE